jgi:hypothetical protein
MKYNGRDQDEALIEGQDLMDWSNANYEVLEEEIK